MKLIRLQIEKLFDIFDYDIPIENKDNLLIITGPNGFGKTKILNIIYHFFRKEFEYFDKLVFERIILYFDNEIFYEIKKNEKLAITEIGVENSDNIYSNVHLIKEQRLLKPELNMFFGNGEFRTTIIQLAKDLAELIEITFNNWLELSQKLDSTFPKRLLNGAVQLSEEEFKNRFKQLTEKQNLLKSYNLTDTEQEVPDYDPENAKVLSIYLKDSEAKFGVFDTLLQKLNLFTTILNERRFTFKTIQISKTEGFYFETVNKKRLDLADLSSGEQHEVVLLYELIFNAKENTLILIDEPEISLHVTWQKEFVSDLLKIIELQKVQVVIATHSPQIISNRWDLVYNLEKRN